MRACTWPLGDLQKPESELVDIAAEPVAAELGPAVSAALGCCVRAVECVCVLSDVSYNRIESISPGTFLNTRQLLRLSVCSARRSLLIELQFGKLQSHRRHWPQRVRGRRPPDNHVS